MFQAPIEDSPHLQVRVDTDLDCLQFIRVFPIWNEGESSCTIYFSVMTASMLLCAWEMGTDTKRHTKSRAIIWEFLRLDQI